MVSGFNNSVLSPFVRKEQQRAGANLAQCYSSVNGAAEQTCGLI